MRDNQSLLCRNSLVWMRNLLVLAVICVLTMQDHKAIAAAQYAGDWVRVLEHTPFEPRDTSEGVVFKGKMWLSNGWLKDPAKGEILKPDLWSSSDGVKWELISTNTPYDGYSEMVVFHDKIWAVKGSVWNSEDGVNWKRVLEIWK